MRRPLRASLACGLLTVTLAACARENRVSLPGNDPGLAEVGLVGALVLYVLVPIAIVVVVGTLAWLPGVVGSKRYRPGQEWTAPPVWFAGPPDPDAAVENADPGDLVRGGASGSW